MDLPQNNLGAVIMLIALILVAVTPLIVVFWLVKLFAPWWVALPLGLSASFITFAKWVKFKKNEH